MSTPTTPATPATPALQRGMGPWQLCGVAVGLVISGEYFGWSYGWAHAGPLGFALVTLVVALFYAALMLGYAELCTSWPQAGGPHVFAERAWGPQVAALVGAASVLVCWLTPSAIALAIGAYVRVQWPGLDVRVGAVGAYVLFTALNWRGVRLAATLELVVTLLAIVELLVFAGVVAPGFAWSHLLAGAWAGQSDASWAALPGMLASLPFAIWFFFGIEAAAMTAEEVHAPQRDFPRAFGLGMLTLVLLAVLVMLMAGGSGDWRELAERNDPLPQAMQRVVGPDSGWVHMLVGLGMLGLVASFHGLLLSGSRQVYALARAGVLGPALAHLHPRWHTPHRALLLGAVVGTALVMLDEVVHWDGQGLTANLVSLAVLAGLLVYTAALASLIRLRRQAPTHPRPFRMPGYPALAWLTLATAMGFAAVMVWQFPVNAALLALALGVWWAWMRHRAAAGQRPGRA